MSGRPGGGPVVLLGANGMLAQMVRAKAPYRTDLHCYDLPEFDLTDTTQTNRVLSGIKPDVIINCAAYTAVDTCEEHEDLANRVNAAGVAGLAAIARTLDTTLVHISTDYVFAGTHKHPYREEDPTGPLSAYGRSKLKGEQAIIASGLEKFYIIRTSWLYGPGGKNFVETILRLAAEREELQIVADQIGSPTYTEDLADAIFNLLGAAVGVQALQSCPYGLYHFADEGQCSWYEFAKEIVSLATGTGLSLRVRRLLPIRTEDYPLPAPRPAYSVLDKSKYSLATGKIVPDWQSSLRKYFTVRNRKNHMGDKDKDVSY